MAASEWQLRTLGSEVIGLDAGVSVNADDRPHGLGEIGVLKTSALTGGVFNPKENKSILPAERARARVSPVADSILVSRMNTPALVGESAYVDRSYPDVFLPDRIWQLRFRNRDECCVHWVAHYLQSYEAKAYISLNATGTSGSMKNLPKSRFLAMPVRWPPFPEQRRIAEILDTLEDVIRKTELLIAKLKQMKQGLLRDLLTCGIDENGELRDPGRHPEQFKDSPLGRIPKTWRVVPVEELGEIITGTTPPSSDPLAWGDDLPFVTPAEVSNDEGILAPERAISASGRKYVRELAPGAVLVVCIGSTLGKVGLAPWACATNQQINAVVCALGNEPVFVHSAIRFHVRQLHRAAGLQAVPIVNKSQFGRMMVPLAPSDEQKRIAGRLLALETQIGTEARESRKLRLLKQGIMNDLLTGRVRITPPLEPAQ